MSGVLGRHHVSIRLMEQESLVTGGSEGAGAGDASAVVAESTRGVVGDSVARLVFVTHPAFERDVQECLHELRHLDVVDRIGGLLRVIGP